jgi:hypothetical protein
MKPGDILQLRPLDTNYETSINYLDIWNRPDDTEALRSRWKDGDVGLFLGHRYMVTDGAWDDLVMVEVLIHGGKWWVFEDEVEVIDEAR